MCSEVSNLHIYIHTYIHTHIHACMCTCVYICIYVYIVVIECTLYSHYSAKIWKLFNTSIIILWSEVGFTFGNEIVQMLLKICDVYIYIHTYIYIYIIWEKSIYWNWTNFIYIHISSYLPDNDPAFKVIDRDKNED